MRTIDGRWRMVDMLWMPKGEWGMQFGSESVQSIRHPVLGGVSEFGGFSSERKAPLVGIWKCSRLIFKNYLICALSIWGHLSFFQFWNIISHYLFQYCPLYSLIMKFLLVGCWRFLIYPPCLLISLSHFPSPVLPSLLTRLQVYETFKVWFSQSSSFLGSVQSPVYLFYHILPLLDFYFFVCSCSCS